MESAQDHAIFALDPAGTLRSWNPGARRFKGYSADEIIGRPITLCYPRAQVASRFTDCALACAARDACFGGEGRRVGEDGARPWANVLITALRNDDDEPVGFSNITRALTERRAAQDRAMPTRCTVRRPSWRRAVAKRRRRTA